jgi:hypothetical protein
MTQGFRRNAASRLSQRAVRLVLEELESRNLMSAGSSIAPAVFDVALLTGQISAAEKEGMPAPAALAVPNATTVASLDSIDWQRMVESSWSGASGHSISSELARTVHYAKVDVVDDAVIGADTVDDSAILLVQDGTGSDAPAAD